MKKHLKKLMLLAAFVGFATITKAGVWVITCDNGESFNFISLEEDCSEEDVEAAEEAYIDLCL